MPPGMNKYDAKQRREQRRRNHIAYDLGSSKYRQRVKKEKSDKWTYKEYQDDGDENLS